MLGSWAAREGISELTVRFAVKFATGSAAVFSEILILANFEVVSFSLLDGHDAHDIFSPKKD